MDVEARRAGAVGDGSGYRIVKVFHDARTLTDDLTALGWSARIRTMSGNYVGVAEPPAAGR